MENPKTKDRPIVHGGVDSLAVMVTFRFVEVVLELKVPCRAHTLSH